MAEFALTSFLLDGRPRAGLVRDGRIHDLAQASGRPDFSSILAVLAEWETNSAIIATAAERLSSEGGAALDEVTLLSPVGGAVGIFCAGANYRDHMDNMARRMGVEPEPDPNADGGMPIHFVKAPQCCVGSGFPVASTCAQFDWEGELVAVIGRDARNVAVAEALDHVAGYTIGNDLSARGNMFRRQLPPTSIFHHSWMHHKSFEHAAPVGPVIVPAAQIRDVDGLRIETRVNGVVKQSELCGKMFFSVAEQVSYLSTILTLKPGDLVMTGTPAGAGAETGEFLSPGDVVSVTIEPIGTLVTPIISA